jgi:hypothetical protein
MMADNEWMPVTLSVAANSTRGPSKSKVMKSRSYITTGRGTPNSEKSVLN